MKLIDNAVNRRGSVWTRILTLSRLGSGGFDVLETSKPLSVSACPALPHQLFTTRSDTIQINSFRDKRQFWSLSDMIHSFQYEVKWVTFSWSCDHNETLVLFISCESTCISSTFTCKAFNDGHFQSLTASALSVLHLYFLYFICLYFGFIVVLFVVISVLDFKNVFFLLLIKQSMFYKKIQFNI